ncbi:MAG: FAD-dependent oxidoreductase [Alicyclobacillaceae bacterium]|nr:FAD-dependent oxidoreductase [Alicyclobacillaceae bacterium]
MIENGNTNVTTKIVTKSRTGPQELKVDICVVGAGISGVSAAIEAARLGRKVALVDGLPALGGQAVNSIIGTFCGLFSNGPVSERYQLTHSIADDILRDLGKAGALHYRHEGFTTVVMYDEVALSRWIEETVLQAGIVPVVGAVLREVHREGRRIQAVDLATRYGDLRVSATGFVDASGDAALTWQAGLPCREPADAVIYGSQMLVLEGVNQERQPEMGEFFRRQKEKAAEYGLVRTDGFVMAFPAKGTALVNMTHVETPLEPIAAAVKGIEGKAQADRVLQFLKSEFPEAFQHARVRAYGFPGIRQTRWIVGRKQLTADEVRAGTWFDDAVARTAWPIELHNYSQGYVWEVFSDDHVHYIPLGSMTPPDVDNLVAAGRCIDGDAAALSSVRVMGPCIGMGAAAAHALDMAGEGSVHELNVAELQERLKDNVTRRN